MSICIILFQKLWTKYKRVQLNVGEVGMEERHYGEDGAGVMGATDQLSVKDRKVGGFISNHQHHHFVKYCKLRLQPC